MYFKSENEKKEVLGFIFFIGIFQSSFATKLLNFPMVLHQFAFTFFLVMTPSPEEFPALEKELPKQFPRAEVFFAFNGTNGQKDYVHHLPEGITRLRTLR